MPIPVRGAIQPSTVIPLPNGVPGIVVQELEDGFDLSITRNGVSGTRKFRVPCVFPGGGVVIAGRLCVTWYDFLLCLTGYTTAPGAAGANPNPIGKPPVDNPPGDLFFSGFPGAGASNIPSVLPAPPAVPPAPTVTLPDVFSCEMPWLICQEVTVKGDTIAGYEGAETGDAPKWPNYDANKALYGTSGWPLSPRLRHKNVLLTCKYAPIAFDESFDFTGQSLQLQGNVFGWTGSSTDPSQPADPNQKLDSPVGVMFPEGSYEYHRRQVLVMASAAVFNLIGMVNANCTAPKAIDGNGNIIGTFPVYFNADGNPVVYGNDGNPPAGTSFPVLALPPGTVAVTAPIPQAPFLGFAAPQTMLYMGVRGKRTYLVDGTQLWELTFKFQYNPKKWVRLARPDSKAPNTDGYEYVKALGTGKFAYDATDFNVLTQYTI